MNHDQTKDWRAIAHEEFENRKSLEFELGEIKDKFEDSQEALTATNNYNVILSKKLAELEARNAQLTSKLTHGIKLLRQAKLLFTKYQTQSESLKSENATLKEENIKKAAMLDAEIAQHEKTNAKLATALSKLAAATSVEIGTQFLPSPPVQRDNSVPDVVYANATPDQIEEEMTQRAMFDEDNPRAAMVHEQFANIEAEQVTIEDNEFIDQAFILEKEFNK